MKVVDLYNMDCRDAMSLFLPDNSVDAIVCDPPYGLAFMGKKWDYDVPGVDIWAECLRVLKPGGHLLAFAGTRTQHRMAVRIEDAGFEIRDMIAWVYASGFPKSLDVSKAIDKAAGAEREVLGTIDPRSAFDGRERTSAAINTNWRGAEGREDVRDLSKKEITAPATEAARQWEGWGTALKPAMELITMARKPLIGTVAANVLAHGTGALNIDGCRVGNESTTRTSNAGTNGEGWGMGKRAHVNGSDAGRWPANLIIDGSSDVVAAFPQAKGQQGALTGSEPSSKTANTFGEFAGRASSEPRGDTGSAARFFYCAKASKKDRDEGLESFIAAKTNDGRAVDADNAYQRGASLRQNTHPTVKPTDLMAYLCRLVTPPGGVVFDPFMGSGSTGKAALREGFGFIGCEMDAAYFAIAQARLAAVKAAA